MFVYVSIIEICFHVGLASHILVFNFCVFFLITKSRLVIRLEVKFRRCPLALVLVVLHVLDMFTWINDHFIIMCICVINECILFVEMWIYEYILWLMWLLGMFCLLKCAKPFEECMGGQFLFIEMCKCLWRLLYGLVSINCAIVWLMNLWIFCYV